MQDRPGHRQVLRLLLRQYERGGEDDLEPVCRGQFVESPHHGAFADRRKHPHSTFVTARRSGKRSSTSFRATTNVLSRLCNLPSYRRSLPAGFSPSLILRRSPTQDAPFETAFLGVAVDHFTTGSGHLSLVSCRPRGRPAISWRSCTSRLIVVNQLRESSLVAR